ncbi:MAG: hypothetical protein ABIR70_13035 [Bryobacteraceae bacterium]
MRAAAAKERALEQEFLDTSAERSQFLRDGQPRKANKAYDRLHQLKVQMRRLPDRGEVAFKRMCCVEDVELRLLAAANLLALDEAYAIGVLKEIAALPVGLTSLGAKTTLQEWRSGALTD